MVLVESACSLKLFFFRNYGMRSVSFISDKLTISLTNCKRNCFQFHYDKIMFKLISLKYIEVSLLIPFCLGVLWLFLDGVYEMVQRFISFNFKTLPESSICFCRFDFFLFWVSSSRFLSMTRRTLFFLLLNARLLGHR